MDYAKDYEGYYEADDARKARKPKKTVKEKARKYRDDLSTAYGIGDARGWDDAYDVPKRFLSKTAAAYGYKKGVRNRLRHDKYASKYQKRQ